MAGARIDAGAEHGRIIDEARQRVASGRDFDPAAFEARIEAAGGETERALAQLARVVSVARARALVSAPPAREPEPPQPPRRQLALRTKPTITGNMDVRREREGGSFILHWTTEPKVAGWDVRISERPDVRGDYVVREEQTLPASATTFELQLTDKPVRVHLLGRGRDGRLVRRAVVSALTAEGWDDRWQRRASAS
jgi:hypothetical protein